MLPFFDPGVVLAVASTVAQVGVKRFMEAMSSTGCSAAAALIAADTILHTQPAAVSVASPAFKVAEASIALRSASDMRLSPSLCSVSGCSFDLVVVWATSGCSVVREA